MIEDSKGNNAMEYYYRELEDDPEDIETRLKIIKEREAKERKAKKEQKESKVKEEELIDSWYVIRVFARVMLLFSAICLFSLVFNYIFFALVSDQHGELFFVQPIKCALGTTVYLLLILVKDTIRVCKQIISKVCKNCARIVQIIFGILLILVCLSGIILGCL
jgi:hypothetical protein